MEFYESRGVEPLDQADFIVVNDVCVFSNFAGSTRNPWKVVEAGFKNRSGWFYEGWREDSLAGFLPRLHRVAHAGLKIQDDVLPRYLSPREDARFQIVDIAFKNEIYPKCKDLPGMAPAEFQRTLRGITHPWEFA